MKRKIIRYISFLLAVLIITPIFSYASYSNGTEQQLKNDISSKEDILEEKTNLREDFSLNFYNGTKFLYGIPDINAELSSMKAMKEKYQNLYKKYENELENIKKILAFAYENGELGYLQKLVDSKDEHASVEISKIVSAMLGSNAAEFEEILAAIKKIDENAAKFSDAPLGINAKIAKIDEYMGYLNDEKQAIEDLENAQLALEEYYHYSDTFLWPLSLKEGNKRITSVFGNREIFGASENHTGIDVAGPTAGVIQGADIYAAADGKVVSIRNSEAVSDENWTYGYYVLIQHDNGLYTIYGHASAVLVKKGDTVKRGDVIARVGNTGRSTAPHLHFEVRKYSGAYGSSFTRLDPLSYFKNHPSNQ